MKSYKKIEGNQLKIEVSQIRDIIPGNYELAEIIQKT